MIRALLAGVEPEAARLKPNTESWSILEVVCHLYDEEREDFREHLDFILHRQNETWHVIDTEGWVTQRKYNEQNFAEMQEKFFLDKILKKKVAAATNGIGELQYFTYNDPMNGHLAALDDIEQQVAQSAMQFQGQMSGEDDFQVGILELDERLY